MAGRNYVVKVKTYLVLITVFVSLKPIYSIRTSNCQPSCDWLMYGKSPDGNRVVQSGCGLSSTKLTKLWETMFRNATWPLVVVWNNNLFLSDNGNLYCQNIEDRSVKWVYECQDCEDYSPVIDSGRMYIWNFQIPKRENHIICLDATNGKLIWDYLVVTDFLTHPLIVFKNKVYVCSSNGELICLEGTTGKMLWSYKSKYGLYDPVFSNNNVYLPGIKCLDATTGKVVWDKDKEYVLLSPLAIDNDRIYFCSYNTEIVVVCISATTGEKMFEFFWDKISQSRIITSTCSYDNKLFFTTIKGTSETSKNGIICFDLTNKKVLWEIDTGVHKLCPPTFDNGYIVTGSDQGQLMFIDQNTGKIVKTYNIGQPIGSEIVIASHKLFVVTKKALMCFSN